MSGIKQLGLQVMEVPYGDGTISVVGLSNADIVALVRRFPDVSGLLGDDGKLNGAAAIDLAPPVMAAMISLGTQGGGDEETERLAMQLPAEVQLDLVSAVIKMTTPSGIGPFVARLLGAAKSAEQTTALLTPTTSSPSPSTS